MKFYTVEDDYSLKERFCSKENILECADIKIIIYQINKKWHALEYSLGVSVASNERQNLCIQKAYDVLSRHSESEILFQEAEEDLIAHGLTIPINK